MANFFTMMFSKGKISELQEKNKQLEKALEECSGKLAEKQEHINQTNAFWKKKLREAHGYRNSPGESFIVFPKENINF